MPVSINRTKSRWNGMRDLTGRQKAAGIGVLALVLLIALRFVFFYIGTFYGTEAIRWFNLTIVGFSLASILLVYRAFAQRSEDRSPGNAIALLVGFAALTGSTYAAVQIVFPVTPTSAAAPACSNAPVYGADFLAQTPETGVVSRAGAGRQFPQAGRYPAACTLGFDGFCLGEPVRDPLLGTIDQRWLILHLREELVPAAYVLSQGSESESSDQADEKCSELGGVDRGRAVAALNLTPGPDGSPTAILTSDAATDTFVGYSVTTMASNSRYYKIGANEEAADGFPVPWDYSGFLPVESQPPVKLLLAAVSCLAGNAPDVQSARIVSIEIGSAGLSDARHIKKPNPQERVRLANMACARDFS